MLEASRARPRRALIISAGVLAAASVLAACGSSGSSNTATSTPSASTPTGSAGGNTVAAQLVFGAGPECPQRPLCLPGLTKTYGLTFKDVKTLDSGGPLTVAALKNNDIQVGLIFTTDGNIAANNWVLLKDDKNLQPADQVTPIVNNQIVQAYGQTLQDDVNKLSAKLTTEDLTNLNKQVDIDQKDPSAVATDWLNSSGLLPASPPATKSGPTIIVGSGNISESITINNIYYAYLKALGYPVDSKFNIGTREVYYPALKKGTDVNFIADYGGTLLTFVDPNQSGTPDAEATHAALVKALTNEGVTAFAAAPAQDLNGFVVTQDTAKKYNLVNLSDLAKPAN